MPSRAAWRRAHNAASPSLGGVQEGLFPRFVDTMRRSDSLPSFSPHFVAFVWRYHRRLPEFVPIGPGHEAVDHPGVGKPGLQPALRWRRQGLPSSRGTLVIIRPVLRPRRDQTDSSGPRVSLPDAAPASDNGEGSTQRRFRGSIARLLISLSTLRRGSHPPTTQDSLPVAGPAFPDGIGYPQGSDERFRALRYPPLPSFLAQCQFDLKQSVSVRFNSRVFIRK